MLLVYMLVKIGDDGGWLKCGSELVESGLEIGNKLI